MGRSGRKQLLHRLFGGWRGAEATADRLNASAGAWAVFLAAWSRVFRHLSFTFHSPRKWPARGENQSSNKNTTEVLEKKGRVLEKNALCKENFTLLFSF